MTTMTTPSILLLITLVSLAAMVWLIYRYDMRAARERLRGRSALLSSPYGNIEYAEGGTGVAVLIVHAAAGGWDQGALIADAVLNERFHWIAPSRFGYLRSDCPAGGSVENQAHAYAFLLDRLGIDRVAVVAMSAGGPSALLFAILHPRRVSSLTLLSCGVAAASSNEQAEADRKGNALVRIFRTNFGLWLITRLSRKSLLELMGVHAADALTLGFEQLEWIDRVVEGMHPASLRSEGVAFDNRAELPGKRITAIEAPTLVVHAKDDSLQLYRNAVFAAVNIPHAQLVSFETGGHMVIAQQLATIRAAVQQHILVHALEGADVANRPSAA